MAPEILAALMARRTVGLTTAGALLTTRVEGTQHVIGRTGK
jgi:hypothetical protein